jgi:hypothetical protein
MGANGEIIGEPSIASSTLHKSTNFVRSSMTRSPDCSIAFFPLPSPFGSLCTSEEIGGISKSTKADSIIFVRFFGLSIIRAAYGSQDEHYNRKLIHAATAFNEEAVNSVRPGRYLVSIVHALRYVPSWLPGAGWKCTLQNIARLGEQVTGEPFRSAKERFVRSCPDGQPRQRSTIFMLQEAGIQHDHGLNVAPQLIADLPAPDSSDYKYREDMAKHVSSICYLGTFRDA